MYYRGTPKKVSPRHQGDLRTLRACRLRRYLIRVTPITVEVHPDGVCELKFRPRFPEKKGG